MIRKGEYIEIHGIIEIPTDEADRIGFISKKITFEHRIEDLGTIKEGKIPTKNETIALVLLSATLLSMYCFILYSELSSSEKFKSLNKHLAYTIDNTGTLYYIDKVENGIIDTRVVDNIKYRAGANNILDYGHITITKNSFPANEFFNHVTKAFYLENFNAQLTFLEYFKFAFLWLIVFATITLLLYSINNYIKARKYSAVFNRRA